MPNKRPKTEDFLTFLCFRGTSDLPPHLDFLNQGKSKEPERSLKKPVKTIVKKKGKKGRPPKNAKQKLDDEKKGEETVPVVAPDTSNNAANNVFKADDNKLDLSKEEPKEETEAEEDIPSFPVRKRAEVVADGNRRSNRNMDEKCNNSMESGKRRSNRATKGSKLMLDHLSDEEDDEYYSVVDENSKNIHSDVEVKERKSLKTPSQVGRKSESPSKESETTTKSRKGRSSATLKKKDEDDKETIKSETKEKAAVKRPRQKESPIFIPSPEPSGRMTRQRAFFEPVKVPQREENTTEETEHEPDAHKLETEKQSGGHKKEDVNVEQKVDNSGELSTSNDNDKNKSQLNVFDFSSDDEQPLAKAIKLKKSVTTKASPKKVNQRGAGKKAAVKKNQHLDVQEEENVRDNHVKISGEEVVEGNNKVSEAPVQADYELNKTKGKRSNVAAANPKNSKKKEEEIGSAVANVEKELTQQSPKKAGNVRQGRKKNKTEMIEKADVATNVITDENSISPTRNQRPSRKTKEAATIYMGIIGHRLQLAEDEEDDVSLSSFDRPNVREMEKIENELKRNSGPSGENISSVSPTPKQNKSQEQQLTAVVPAAVAPQTTVATALAEKPTTGRRGRPPKHAKPPALPPAKREIEGMLVKKGVIAKLTQSTENLTDAKDSKTEPSKAGTEDDEDFLLNEELNETKRKLEKSFSDSDDEPLAIKAHVKTSEKGETELDYTHKSAINLENPAANILSNPTTTLTTITSTAPTSTLSMLPLTTTKHINIIANKTSTNSTPPPAANSNVIVPPNNTSAPGTMTTTIMTAGAVPSSPPPNNNTFSIQLPVPVTPTTSQSPFKSIEKKSPVPTSKILNVPATYGIPSASPTTTSANLGNCGIAMNSNFGKSPMYVPQSPAHYHSAHSSQPPPLQQQQSPQLLRPTTSSIPQFSLQSPVKTSSLVAPPTLNTTSSVATHIATPPMQMPPQSPMKYQTPPTTYPPPIEAYPSPKINPNFLTPKFDRNTLSRPGGSHATGNNNTFPSPSPVKFDMSGGSSSGLLKNSSLSAPNITMSPKTLLSGNTNYLTNNLGATTSSAVGPVSNDPLKDEIGSILAANLMPSKEESGKIFGIASVSLAQSSGPDNTKCTLGKCGSIHKPVLGPVVPTESYIGDQLSGKERRKAKVNMTHEQIHKWLIECSSNPDEIQDDLDDDFDSDLRPNNFSSTPPPTRDDKESTSFSSSSKATRDLGKSESAWSAKGPSLKATPVVAASSGSAVNNNRKEEHKLNEPSTSPPQEEEFEKNSPPPATMICDKNMSNKLNSPVPAGSLDEKLTQSEKSDKKQDQHNKKSPVNKDEKSAPKSTVKEVSKQNKPAAVVDSETVPAVAASRTSPTANQKQSTNQKSSNQKKTPSSPVQATNNIATNAATTSTALSKPGRKKHISEDSDDKPLMPSSKLPKDSTIDNDATTSAAAISLHSAANRTPKRTPVYQQKQTPKQQNSTTTDLKISTTTSHKRGAATAVPTSATCNAAFSVDNEKSIYSFDKDDDDAAPPAKAEKPSTYRRQNRRDSNIDNIGIHTTPTTSQRTPPTKPKRNAAAVAEIANKELAGGNSQTSSVSLTLSPSEKNKLVKVSLDADNKTGKSLGGKGKGKKAAEALKKAVQNDNDSDSGDGHTFYIPLQGVASGGDGEGGIQGVAVKLGREGPDGPNQKVIMHATLVTKAQMRSNTKPIPETMNVSDIVKNLMSSGDKKSSSGGPSTSAAAAAAANNPSSANSLKNVPIGTVQPRFKGDAVASPSTTAGGGAITGGALQRVNSNSSLFSGSVKSRNAAVAGASNSAGGAANKKFKDDVPIKMSNNTAFPRHDDPTQMVEAPIFRPTEKEFADPIEFIERITPIAARFGICKIIPPASFKPECRIADEMRFTAYNQYVHKLLHRWGPSAKEFCAIKKYLATQSIVMNHPPWIGGMEVDLPRLYHTVQELGGLKEVIEKKKWARVAEEMCIPKLAQDRVTKLDDIYCKYLLPYDTLSPAERQKLFDEVEADWAKREARARRNADRFVNTESVSNEDDDVSSENDEEESEEEVDGVSMECIVKGRSMPLSQFFRIARNTMALWFKNTEPTVNEVEAEFWRHVAVRDSHVCVHSGSIDSSGWGFGFPSPGPKGKGSNYARHPWNLKVLTNNPGSVLRSLGPVMGVTVPTLHVGMLFSACCWYRDPHGLSWIEYLHTGASKLWYGIPDDQSANFRAALTSLIPTHCQNKTIWLPCDTVMVPPHMLTDRGVSLCRIEQKPGEFIVVFPRAYTSSLATGYVVSESVYFATTSWLDLAKDDFRVSIYFSYKIYVYNLHLPGCWHLHF